MKAMKSWLLAPLIALALWAGCSLGGPESGVDENLFLLHALESTYRSWPNSKTAGPQEIADWLARTRPRIARLRTAIGGNELDPEVGLLYDDLLRFLDAYESSLASLEMIGERRHEDDAPDLAWLLLTGLREGSEAERRASRGGAIAGHPSWSELGSLIVNGVQERMEQTEGYARDHHSRAQAEMLKLRDAWSEIGANATAAANKLTETHGWKPGEAGFDGYKGRTTRDSIERRPRDPFVLIRMASERTEGDTPASLLDAAQVCVSAVDLVPPGDMYDPFRADFLKQAAALGVRATVMELDPFSYSLGPGGRAAVRALSCRQSG